MADAQKDSAPETPEKGGLPTPSFSEASEGQPSSESKSVDVSALVRRQEELERKLQEFERREQSIKDKRLGEHDKRLQELERMGGLLKEHGGDVNKAVRDMRILEAEERLLASNPEPELPSRKLPGKEQMEEEYERRVTDYLKKRGITDPADIREATKDMAGKVYQNVEDALVDVAAMADAFKENRGRQQAPASQGAASTPKGSPPVGKSQEELEEELAKLQSGDLRDPDNRKRRAEIRAELQKYVPLETGWA